MVVKKVKVCRKCKSEDIIKETCTDHKDKRGLTFRYNEWYCYDCGAIFIVPKGVEVEIDEI